MGKKESNYRDEKGKEVGTYTESLDWIITVKLEPLQDYLNTLAEDDDFHVKAKIAQILLADAEQKFYEASEYIKKNYGTIELVRAMYYQDIKAETILDVVFTPAKEVTA